MGRAKPFHAKPSTMKHNNMIAQEHFKKYWQRYVKTWFDQPAKKKARRMARQKKAAAVAPRPVAGSLRSVVHPPTARYNVKVRVGRGFSLQEIKAAKLNKREAKSLGILSITAVATSLSRGSRQTCSVCASTAPSWSSSQSTPSTPRRDGSTPPIQPLLSNRCLDPLSWLLL